MKKITAFMLVALMIVMAFPFTLSAAAATITTAEELALISDGEYELGADIDLSAADWTTIAEFTGTLDGKGHTITLPADKPMFDTVKGTITDVKFAGNVTLDKDDKSAATQALVGEATSYVVAPLARIADGAIIKKVVVDVNVTLTVDEAIDVSLGTVVGFAKSTTFDDILVKGNVKFTYSAVSGINPAFGGLVAIIKSGVAINKVQVSSAITLDGVNGHRAGITAHNADNNPTINNTVFNGSILVKNTVGNNAAVGEWTSGIVSYARDLTITNCAFDGSITDETGGGVAGIVAVHKTKKATTTVTNGAVTGTLTTTGSVRKSHKTDTALSETQDAFLAIEVIGEIFEVAEGKLSIKDIAVLTPVVNPDDGNTGDDTTGDDTTGDDTTGDDTEENAPTGDLTALVAAIALISLAGATVIAKKKVTE